MNAKQDEALEAGHLTYNTGKPCRRGHVSDRYTSNGMCVGCVKMKDAARKEQRVERRRKYVNARVQNLQARTFMVAENHRSIVQEICDALQFGDASTIAEIAKFARDVYDRTPSPKALGYDAIVKILRWDGKSAPFGMLELENVIEQDRDTGDMYVNHNGHKYELSRVEEVISKRRLFVAPTYRGQK